MRVHYAALAADINTLPPTANCSDLLEVVELYLPAGCEGLQPLREMSPDASYLDGLFKLCEILEKDNPRFDAGRFMEWATESL